MVLSISDLVGTVIFAPYPDRPLSYGYPAVLGQLDRIVLLYCVEAQRTTIATRDSHLHHKMPQRHTTRQRRRHDRLDRIKLFLHNRKALSVYALASVRRIEEHQDQDGQDKRNQNSPQRHSSLRFYHNS